MQTCFYPFVNSMINFTNMYIITFVHYIGIFFLFLVRTRCVNTNIYIYIWLVLTKIQGRFVYPTKLDKGRF